MRIAPPLDGRTLGSETNDFVVAAWTDPGGDSKIPRLIAPLHLHREDDEGWYVLEGTLRVQHGEEVVELHAGSGLLVELGTPHTFWNPSELPARYLLFMTPRISALIAAIHALDEKSPTAMCELFEKYRSVLL